MDTNTPDSPCRLRQAYVNKNTEFLLVTSKETGLAYKCREHCVFMYCEQNIGQNRNIKIGNKSFERLEQFKYLETILTNKTALMKRLKGRPNLENASYDSVQTLLVFQFAIWKCKD
jgi:hypothetical protein